MVFLHRRHSLQPFVRRFLLHKSPVNNFLDYLVVDGERVSVTEEYAKLVGETLLEYNAVWTLKEQRQCWQELGFA